MKIELLTFQYSDNKGNDLLPDGVREPGVPDWTGHDQAAKGEERGYYLRHFAVAAFLEVTVPEAKKQGL
jgi:hypothetical protein